MIFNEVIEDIIKLIGLKLESVRPGSGITILNVDREHENLLLKTKSGDIKSRPLVEIERIWNELLKQPAVHVDKVLNGSGTSRNQPETILANLPYIEYAKINNKKHLVYVGDKTHPYGTILEMDKAKAALLTEQLQALNNASKSTFIIVTEEIKDSIDHFQAICSGSITTKEQGLYSLSSPSGKFIFITPSLIGLKTGIYPILEVDYYNEIGSEIITPEGVFKQVQIDEFTILARKKQ